MAVRQLSLSARLAVETSLRERGFVPGLPVQNRWEATDDALLYARAGCPRCQGPVEVETWHRGVSQPAFLIFCPHCGQAWEG